MLSDHTATERVLRLTTYNETRQTFGRWCIRGHSKIMSHFFQYRLNPPLLPLSHSVTLSSTPSKITSHQLNPRPPNENTSRSPENSASQFIKSVII